MTTKKNNGAAGDGSVAEVQGAAGADLSPAMMKLVYKLKGAIDQRGRYAFRLNDMAAGFAAGQGVSAMKARSEIERAFTGAFGQSTQAYLDNHYNQLRESGQLRPRGRSLSLQR